MYSFQPLADIPVDHIGFAFVVCFCVFSLIASMIHEPESFFVYFFVSSIACGFTYGVSYVWTDQETKKFVNEPVIAEFAGYAPEGYREKSGKSYVDHHYVYVVYKVNGNPILLQGNEGFEYPKTAILYKN